MLTSLDDIVKIICLYSLYVYILNQCCIFYGPSDTVHESYNFIPSLYKIDKLLYHLLSDYYTTLVFCYDSLLYLLSI